MVVFVHTNRSIPVGKTGASASSIFVSVLLPRDKVQDRDPQGLAGLAIIGLDPCLILVQIFALDLFRHF